MTKLTKLGARRLLKLAKILDTADALHKRRKEPTYNQFQMVHSCGTPACALGHYAAATKARFKIDRLSETVFYKGNSLYHEAQVAIDEFGVSRGEGYALFSFEGMGGAKTAKQAAKYIRSFVKRKGVE
jgi:hypothetical protein